MKIRKKLQGNVRNVMCLEKPCVANDESLLVLFFLASLSFIYWNMVKLFACDKKLLINDIDEEVRNKFRWEWLEKL